MVAAGIFKALEHISSAGGIADAVNTKQSPQEIKKEQIHHIKKIMKVFSKIKSLNFFYFLFCTSLFQIIFSANINQLSNYGINYNLLILIDLIFIYLLSCFLIKLVTISENNILIIYPLRIFNRKVFIEFSQIKKIRFYKMALQPDELWIKVKKRLLPYFITLPIYLTKKELEKIVLLFKSKDVFVTANGIEGSK